MGRGPLLRMIPRLWKVFGHRPEVGETTGTGRCTALIRASRHSLVGNVGFDNPDNLDGSKSAIFDYLLKTRNIAGLDISSYEDAWRRRVLLPRI